MKTDAASLLLTATMGFLVYNKVMENFQYLKIREKKRTENLTTTKM